MYVDTRNEIVQFERESTFPKYQSKIVFDLKCKKRTTILEIKKEAQQRVNFGISLALMVHFTACLPFLH